LPGVMSDWVKIIPSYYLTDLMHRAVHFDAGWAEIWKNCVLLLTIDLCLMAVGSFALRRRLA